MDNSTDCPNKAPWEYSIDVEDLAYETWGDIEEEFVDLEEEFEDLEEFEDIEDKLDAGTNENSDS